MKHTSDYEQSLQDTLDAMTYIKHHSRLKGWATQEGTDKYYRMSQYGEVEGLDVHHENFRGLLHNEMLKLSSIGIGTYIGDTTD